MPFGFGTSSKHRSRGHYATTPSRTTHRRNFLHRKDPNRRAGGLKAALHNPNTTSTGRREAKMKLRAMGRGREAHVPFSVRLKRFFGIRNHHHRRTY
ncbi:hypothetical protein M422DRAFT_149083 [Sphaerobolus stellatus SS14]|nr:hypothetical protein M422DRAFT_149083 [Sphaerobolus stellatus SS14]